MFISEEEIKRRNGLLEKWLTEEGNSKSAEKRKSRNEKRIEDNTGKSYSHKPHLAELPYDRRSTNFDELKERYLSCMDKKRKMEDNETHLKKLLEDELSLMEDHKENIKEWSDRRKTMVENNKAFEEADYEVLKEKIGLIDNVIDELDDLEFPKELQDKVIQLKRDCLVNTSWLTPEQQKEVNSVMGELAKYSRENYNYKDNYEELKVMDTIRENMSKIHDYGAIDSNLPELEDKKVPKRTLAKYDREINSEKRKMGETQERIKELKSDIKRTNTMKLDYFEEGINTIQRIEDLGLLS